MANETIRKEAAKNKVLLWQIAERLGISDSITLTGKVPFRV